MCISIGKVDYLNEFKLFNPWVMSNGIVTWVPEVKLYTKCSIKIKDFPFDTQCCEINFYSWAHTSSQMKIQINGNKNKTNITHLADSTEWIIYDTCASNFTVTTSADLNWWVNRYVIKIKRQSDYYIYSLVLPCLSKFLIIIIFSIFLN